MSLLWLLGCLRELGFYREADQASCAWRAVCFGEDEPACLEAAEAARTPRPASCDYDGFAASECVRGMRAMPCPTEHTELGLPSACDRVWMCP